MLYSQQDIQNARNQLLRRIGLMAALAILPNVAGIVVMYTIRIEWLSVLLGCLGGAMAIFTWGLFCYPVYAYLRYAREVVTGRSHEFRGTLTTIAAHARRIGATIVVLGSDSNQRQNRLSRALQDALPDVEIRVRVGLAD